MSRRMPLLVALSLLASCASTTLPPAAVPPFPMPERSLLIAPRALESIDIPPPLSGTTGPAARINPASPGSRPSSPSSAASGIKNTATRPTPADYQAIKDQLKAELAAIKTQRKDGEK